jgi:putative oxidoreductase
MSSIETSFPQHTVARFPNTFTRVSSLDSTLRTILQRWGVPALRVALGIVFVWFGALKIAGQSPVVAMIQTAFPFMPEPFFLRFLGVFEIAIGAGLISGVALRLTLAMFLGQMSGTLMAPLMAPSLFFARGNLLLLTADGEFVVKNFVLITAGLVIAAYALKPVRLPAKGKRSLLAMVLSLL